jgi:hypothetical protein
MNNKVKEPNSKWDLFMTGTIMPLTRLIELWATEENATNEVIISRLSNILNRSNDYIMVQENFTIPDPNVARLLKEILEKGNWNKASGDAYDKKLMKSFYSGNNKVSDKLADSKKTILVKDLSVDCDMLFEVISGFGLPVPDFLRLVSGEPPTKTDSITVVSEQIPLTEDEQTFLTVKDFCAKHTAFTVGGVRKQLFNRETNGLEKSGAALKMGSKVLIDPEKYFEWVRTNGKTG